MNITKLIKSGKDFNYKVDGCYYYRIKSNSPFPDMFMRLRNGELFPEQLTKKGWVKC